MIHKPSADQVPAYYIHMFNQIPDSTPILDFLHYQIEEISHFFMEMTEEKRRYRYAENKWTPKQILNHITDMERVFAYRALAFARNDQNILPGAEEDDYAAEAQADDFDISVLISDFTAVRNSSISLFRMVRKEVWDYNGNANNTVIPLRAIPFFIGGHATHHIKIIKERYL